MVRSQCYLCTIVSTNVYLSNLLKYYFQPGQVPHIIIVTGPPCIPGQDLNPGPFSLVKSALLTDLTRPDNIEISACQCVHSGRKMGD